MFALSQVTPLSSNQSLHTAVPLTEAGINVARAHMHTRSYSVALKHMAQGPGPTDHCQTSGLSTVQGGKQTAGLRKKKRMIRV